jgi:hypothetical protein
MIMLRRRALGGMVLGASLVGWRPCRPNPVPPAQKLRFTISRNNSDIGVHELRFEQVGDDLTVHIDVQMRVGLGPFTFFHYHHQGEERWHGGQFMSLDTQTNDDGDKLHVHAQRTGDHIRVEATALAPQDLPGTALPLTHWNVACMHTKLFNPQDGTVMQEQSVTRGSEIVVLGNGTRVEATRYALNGKAPIEDWYDEKQIWTALRATVKDGSTLIYTRQV